MSNNTSSAMTDINSTTTVQLPPPSQLSTSPSAADLAAAAQAQSAQTAAALITGIPSAVTTATTIANNQPINLTTPILTPIGSINNNSSPVLPTAVTSPTIANNLIQADATINTPSGPLSASAVTQLIEDLRASDLQIRLSAFKQLKLISSALGPIRSRTELIPYLTEFVDDEDEIILILATELSELIDSIGGSEYSQVLLIPLEHLAGTEESAVRDKTVESIIKITGLMNYQSVIDYILPLVRKLANAEWFTSRISAAGLFHIIYPRIANNSAAGTAATAATATTAVVANNNPTPSATANQSILKELRTLFIKLCSDETPMVRRAACAHLGLFAAVLDYQSVKTELFPPFSKLAKDDQDSVRLLTVAASVPIAAVFKPADNVTKMLPMIFGLCSDKSWRVRYMIADKFCDLCVSMGAAESKSDDLVDAFCRLLSDDESEVRTAAAFKVGEVAKLVGSAQSVKKLLSPLKLLVKDQSQYVRAALGSVIMSISTVIPKSSTLEHLVPLFLILLKDSNSEVRLNIISRLEQINSVMSIEMLSASLLPAIIELAGDNKWRVRLQIIQHIPILAEQLGHEFFDSKLSDLCMNWLGDSVYSIRQSATENLTKLATVFGISWTKLNILPKVLSLASNKSYLYRMTAITAIRDLSSLLGDSIVINQLLPVIIKLCNDPVPNVKFNSIKTLQYIITNNYIGMNKSTIINNSPTIPTLLTKLIQDPDQDVKFYALQCQIELNKKE